MSKFEDYSEVSKVYDKERTAMGADTIAGLLHVYGGKPLKVILNQIRLALHTRKLLQQVQTVGWLFWV